MYELAKHIGRSFLKIAALASGVIATLAMLVPLDAQALPAFARQTGQNCVACHAGGQFPELTPYGRMFKMTGYTIGSRGIPLSVMGVLDYANVSNTSKSENPKGPGGDFQKNGDLVFGSASLFIAGKITDNIGLFSQITYNKYDHEGTDANGDPNGKWVSHTNVDNIDLRYADRFVDANSDLIIGVSANNNPSVTDPWNTAAAWMQYVPPAGLPSYQFADASTPYPSNATGGNVAGLTAYAYWNQKVYAELGFYQTANQVFNFMSAGIASADKTMLKGDFNPYGRLAFTHEWGPNSIMVGATGGEVHLYDNNDSSDPNNAYRVRNVGVDTQYQYLLDPHAITVQAAYMKQKTNLSANGVAGLAPSGNFFTDPSLTDPLAAGNSSDTTNTFRAKLTYVYRAQYGGSLAFFNLTGTTDTALQSSGFESTCTNGESICSSANGGNSVPVNGNLSGDPATRGMTYELFWTPIQYIRVGMQYTAYNKYNGASSNYDGFGRNASDNNTLFGYVWLAY